jgi:Ca-activated chloride channel family protein
VSPAPARRRAEKKRFVRALSGSGTKRVLRPTAATLGFLVLAAVGFSYPLLFRGDEILNARWSEPWALVGLVLVPVVFYFAVLRDDARTPRLRLGNVAPLRSGPAGIRV